MLKIMLALSLLAPSFLALSGPALAQIPPLDPALSGLGFLLGYWLSDSGSVADSGGTAKGSSTITAEAGGAVLLRRDHTDLFDQRGNAAGGFDQIMMIYPEAGSVHADYSDGSHVIHYVSAAVTPGQSVVFTSAAQPGEPVFKLSYTRDGADKLGVSFAIAPPGQSDFRAIATGTAHKVANRP